MVIVRLGGLGSKVTDDYRGFRKGVYVRVTEVNPKSGKGLRAAPLFLRCPEHLSRVETGLVSSHGAPLIGYRAETCPGRHVVLPALRFPARLLIASPEESIASCMARALPLSLHLRHAQGGDEMGTTWNSNQENKNGSNTGRLAPPRKEVERIGRDAASVWTRADKIGAIACLALLGVLLAVSACSKQEPKPALVGVSTSAPKAAASVSAAPPELPSTGTMANVSGQPVSPKKARRQLAANVKYSDANSGVSFMYPRRAALASGDKAQTASADASDLPMNFVEPGGMAVATVALPDKQYAGTDFEAAQFRVNVNRSVSADECPHFAFVDTSDADGEPIDAESVKVGTTDMKMTSEFAGSATRQLETRYYHNYENGACYEYVLGLSTAGFGQEGVQAVDRDEVFGRLEKILATAKIRPVEQEQVARKQESQKHDVQKEDAQNQAVQKQEPAKQSTEESASAPDPGK